MRTLQRNRGAEMTETRQTKGALVATLNDLLQLDHDAVHA
jgi:hypothetical protein